MYEYKIIVQQMNVQIYFHHSLYYEIGRLHNMKDNGKQYVFNELTYTGAELVSHKFCGDLFHRVPM